MKNRSIVFVFSISIFLCVLAQIYSPHNSALLFTSAQSLVDDFIAPSFSSVGLRISSDESFDYHNLPGNGSKDNPYRIENRRFIVYQGIGILVYNTSKYFIINNCTIKNKYAAILMNDIAEGTASITNCTIAHNRIYGFLIERIHSLSIHNNTIIDSPSLEYVTPNIHNFGMLFLNCKNISITNNMMINNGLIHSSIGGNIGVIDSSNLYIVNNSLTIGYNGISLIRSNNSIIARNFISHHRKAGFYSLQSNDTLFTNNTVDNNNNILDFDDGYNLRFGIFLSGSLNGNFTYNTIKNHINYGFSIDMETFRKSENNYICYNNFINNSPAYSQAYDAGQNNFWYNVTDEYGNYWSDIGTNSTYSIDGSANSIDKYPSSSYIIPCDYFEKHSERTSFFYFMGIFTLLIMTIWNRKRKTIL